MRAAIVSDTHGNWEKIAEEIKKENVDCLFFLGDHARDGKKMESFLKIPAYIVRGNCDRIEDGDAEQIVELGGWKIFLCHGHHYHVKEQLQTLFYRGLELGVDIILYGHTHRAYYEETDGLTIINPGSVSRENMYLGDASWGILTLSENKFEKNLKKYEKRGCKTSKDLLE